MSTTTYQQPTRYIKVDRSIANLARELPKMDCSLCHEKVDDKSGEPLSAHAVELNLVHTGCKELDRHRKGEYVDLLYPYSVVKDTADLFAERGFDISVNKLYAGMMNPRIFMRKHGVQDEFIDILCKTDEPQTEEQPKKAIEIKVKPKY